MTPAAPPTVSLHVREIAWRRPEDAFAALADQPVLAWLDSAATPDEHDRHEHDRCEHDRCERSRYSTLCAQPFRLVEVRDGQVTVDGERRDGDPFAAVEAELSRWRIEPGTAPVPFAGGAVGFFGYELGGTLERLPARHPDPLGLPDMGVAFYDVVVAFDQRRERCWLLSSGLPAPDPAQRAERAVRRSAETLALLDRVPSRPQRPVPLSVWTADLDRPAYEDRVRRVLEYIRAGDVFQANLTLRHQAPRPPGIPASELYLRLRAGSPAPFAAFLGFRSLALLSASPERFLRLDPPGRIETRPIKGTRPRGDDPGTDRRLRAELLGSVKDRAENLMIVDLMRNDLGRVAVLGSVTVPSLCEAEAFATVHHLVSEIRAQLRPTSSAVDLLRACFPGGSVTGAPKIRAMEIIDELEASRRGPYCGCIAWLGYDGAMDSSIVIRTVVATDAVLIAQAGGGIVADSDPAAEYEEMRLKLEPLLRALGGMA